MSDPRKFGPRSTFKELSDLATDNAVGEGENYYAAHCLELHGALEDGSPIILTFNCTITPCRDPETIRLIEQERAAAAPGEG
jgi:hypothetical protein